MKKNLKEFWQIKNIKAFFKNNKLLILIILFFIVWKFFLIHTLWRNINLPPEPIDSFIYIAHLDSVIQCPSFLFCENSYSLHHFAGWEHLIYRLFFGTIGKIFHWSAGTTYHYSFYIGTLLLIPTLLFFLRKLTTNKNLINTTLFFLALYNGGSSYHGFFWVVPTFFSLILFFIMFGIVLDENNKNWRYTLPILAVAASLNHVMSVYSSSIFFFYFIFKSLFNKKINLLLLKKTIIIIIFSIIPYSVSNHVINKYHNSTNPFSIKSLVNVDKNNLNNSISAKKSDFNFLPGFQQVKADYFNWLFPNIIGVTIFIFIIALIIHYQEYSLLSIFLSSLVFTIISMKSIFAVRSLLYLWPITYILYAYGAYYFIKYIKNNFKQSILRKIILIFFSFAILIFTILNIGYAYLLNQDANLHNQINLPNRFNDFLKQHQLSEIYCSSTIIGANPLYNSKTTQLNFCDKNLDDKKYFITFYESYNNSLLQKIIARIKNRPLPTKINKIHDYPIPPEFKFYKQFGDIIIYKKQ